MSVAPIRIDRPMLRDLRPLKSSPRRLLASLPRVQRGSVLSSLPVLSSVFAVAAAWDVARPLGLAVASMACLLMEFRFTPDEE